MQVRLIRAVVLVAAIALSATACGKYSYGSIMSLKSFKDGLTLYEKGDYKGAIPKFEESIGRNPEFGFSYFFLGNSYDSLYRPARKGEAENDSLLPKAVEHYRNAISKLATATEPQTQQFRKLSYEYLIAAYGSDKLNDFAQAEPAAKELIAIEPNEPSNYQALAKLYEDQGQYDEAEAMFLKAVEVKSGDPAGYQLLAGYFNRQGQFDKTMDAFQKRAELEPNNPEAWHTMGSYFYEKAFRDKSLARDVSMKYVMAGLAAEDKALGINGEYFEAVTYKNLLLRQQALLERSPAVQKQLLEEADRLHKRALELQKKQGAIK